VIGNGKGMPDGEIAVGARWPKQLYGGHLASFSQNNVAIGICLVGNFDATRPSTKQMASLKALIESLRKRCKLKATAVKTHQQIHPRHTRCPGRYFDSKKLVKELS
jgi:N-acetyl-anhydromuramyl-L-alanine amidase AmpD